jgi:hypothetical protein
MVRLLLIGTLLVALVATGFVSWGFYRAWLDAKGWPPLDRLKLFLDAYKAIGVGFLVALLAVVVPYYLQETRDRLERFKESRVKYSEAKTSVMYLPETITSFDDVGEAVAAVQSAHEKLHLAETYRNELRKHLSWHPHPDTWVDRNYWELMAVRRVLHANLDKWPAMKADERLKAVDDALGCVRKRFGHYNDNEEWWSSGQGKVRKVLHNKVLDPVRNFWRNYWRDTKTRESAIDSALNSIEFPKKP